MADLTEGQQALPSGAPTGLESLFVQPPQEQIQNAIDAISEAAEAAAATAASTPELAFIPPFQGMTVTSPDTGNTYTIAEVIGEGAFGVVYAAQDVWLNELAVKVLKPRGTYEQMEAAAIQEFDKLRNMRHPNVTYVVDAFSFQGSFYIITERCWASLDKLFTYESFNGLNWVHPIARCLLQAVHFAHIQGYAHQDIHVGNVFVAFHRNEMGEKDTNVATFKLGDLGIMKLLHEMDATNTALNDSIWPPEFIDGATFGQLGLQADIYHCGLLFLQLALNRRLRFEASEIVAGVPRQMAEGLPPPLNFAISKSLRRHVTDRTQTALEFWRDLTAAV